MIDRRTLASWMVVVGCAAGCGSTVEVRPGAEALAPSIATVVGLPISLGWGGPLELRRVQRRVGDTLIGATGGRAVIAEELVAGEDDAAVASALRALGEDPTRALTFSLTVGMGGRLVAGVSAIPGFISGKRLVVDFRARIDVRHLGSPEVLGTVETATSGVPNEPEVAPDGTKRAPMEAIAAAIERAVAAFAPQLGSSATPAAIVEIPVEASRGTAQRLAALGALYPELSLDDTQALAASRNRFLVLDPGTLRSLGLLAGDLLGVPGGETSASRAALARAVARGRKPLLAVERGGQRYVLAAR